MIFVFNDSWVDSIFDPDCRWCVLPRRGALWHELAV